VKFTTRNSAIIATSYKQYCRDRLSSGMPEQIVFTKRKLPRIAANISRQYGACGNIAETMINNCLLRALSFRAMR
jgi:hypothetical protein